MNSQMSSTVKIEYLQDIELTESGRSTVSSVSGSQVPSFHGVSIGNSDHYVSNGVVENDLQQRDTIERLPTFERITIALLDEVDDGKTGNKQADVKGKRIVNVAKLGAQDRHMLIEKLIKHIENDNLQLLQKLRERLDQVGVEFPTVEVRYRSLCVEAECEVVHGKPLPTLWSTAKGMLSGIANLSCLRQRAKISILKDVSGIIKPRRREKQAGIHPDSDLDTYMKGISVEGLKSTLQTDYILKILGLDICSDTMIGDAMRRGISGGQKKRLTTGILVFIASVTMTVLLRTRMAVDPIHANYYMGALFYALIILLVDGLPELLMTVSRLAVFNKQRELCFYPAWAYAIPAAILKVPLSFLEAFVWTTLTYYVIGYSPEVSRFFRQFLLFFLVHLTSTSMYRFIASIFQTVVASTLAGSLIVLIVLLFGGFLIQKPSMPAWLEWGFWFSPLTFGEIGLTVNEFLAPRWGK
ncbi:hypothetical protein H0E87_016020, partial [Populus deltoides]